MIDILMAVYNGEKYLAQQIDSILGQSVGDWHLYICDDGSKDSSFRISSDYAEKYPELITAFRNDKPTGSACANFMGMLKNSASDYVMFSDQDDFWLPDKIKLTLEKMTELEMEYPHSPVLVHSELEITDGELNVTAPSFTRFQGLEPKYTSLNRLLCQNNITGCTVMMNSALTDLVKNVPAEFMLMHDWWAGLAAAAFGHIGFVEKPLIKYRQHGDNQLGAVNNRSLVGAAKIVKQRLSTKKRLSVTYAQAEKFYMQYTSMLSSESREILETYIDIPCHPKLSRAARLVKYGFLKQNFMTAVGQLIFC